MEANSLAVHQLGEHLARAWHQLTEQLAEQDDGGAVLMEGFYKDRLRIVVTPDWSGIMPREDSGDRE